MKCAIICGGRDYRNKRQLFNALDYYHANGWFDSIVHGAAPGADTLAGEWALSRGVLVRAYPADWNAHGRAAGPIRNKLMLDETHPALVIAFPGGRGTANMTALALRANVLVMTVGFHDYA